MKAWRRKRDYERKRKNYGGTIDGLIVVGSHIKTSNTRSRGTPGRVGWLDGSLLLIAADEICKMVLMGFLRLVLLFWSLEKTGHDG